MTQHLPYENASSGSRALNEIEKMMLRFGCSNFGTMHDFEHQKLIVQFKYRGAPVHVEASMAGYAQQWLKTHPWSNRVRRSKVEHEREALRIASLAVCSILRDWIRGQIMAVESGILSFEGAFLGQLVLTSGRTVLEHLETTKLLAAVPKGADAS